MFKNFNKTINNKNLELFICEVERLSTVAFAKKNGNKKKWQTVINGLESIAKSNLERDGDYLFVNTEVEQVAFENLRPWRKGPFSFKNFNLDSEWNGNLKWQRLAQHFDFKDKVVLDVGSGNGYFSYKIGLQNAKFVLGLEPFLLFNYQFRAIQSLTNNTQNVYIAPLRLEQVSSIDCFDTVLSMGVLYHHKSPIEHILKLRQMLKPNGELLLETLIVDGVDGYSLVPIDRYAKMRNVWFIPSAKTLVNWFNKCGFSDVEIIDDNVTTTKEQRRTKWIGENSESLEDFIVNDKTVEGHQRPRRLMLKCKN